MPIWESVEKEIIEVFISLKTLKNEKTSKLLKTFDLCM